MIQKEKQWILCDKKNIIWIVGYRIDDRYKVTPKTKNCTLRSFTRKLMNSYKFIEKQYFGLNKISLSTRLICAVFCFIMYYFRENQQKTGDVYFFIGIAIILISILLFFVHF